MAANSWRLQPDLFASAAIETLPFPVIVSTRSVRSVGQPRLLLPDSRYDGVILFMGQVDPGE
jgi:hypothetical protein